MARSDLLLDIVKAGAQGDAVLFKNALEALVAEERSKQHNVLADQLAQHLRPASNVHRLRSDSNAEHGLAELIPDRALEELVLPDAVRQACIELIEEQHRADLLRAHNLEPRHRLLVAGPPGNGKTTIAEAIATSLAAPLFVVRYESVIGSFLGETAVRLAKLFAAARTQRCVLFFDEFDVIGKERGDEHETGEIKRVVSSLLLQIDRLPSHVVVVAATNHAELLDSAAWRRFQLRLTLPNPNAAQRTEWLARFETRTRLKLGSLRKQIAETMVGVSYAELEQLAEDVLRRRVLAGPDAQVAKIVKTRLQSWSSRDKPRKRTRRG